MSPYETKFWKRFWEHRGMSEIIENETIMEGKTTGEERMNRESLTELLSSIAEKDLTESADIYDHPCTVAVRAINQCFDDIEFIKRTNGKSVSKREKMLRGLSYNPSW